MFDINEMYAKALEDTGGYSLDEIRDRTKNSHILDYGALYKIAKGYFDHKNLKEHDKYKHALINCLAAQSGTGGVLESSFLSGLRELYDVKSGKNTEESSREDDVANQIGRLLGFKYPDGDCDEMVQRYIPKKYPQ